MTKSNSIIVGDCVTIMRDMEPESIDLIFSDPVYNINYHYDEYKDNLADSEYAKWTESWINGCCRILKPDGSIFILMGVECSKHLKLPTNYKVYQKLVWHYSFGQNQKTRYTPSHTNLYWITKNNANPVFNREQILVPSWRQLNGDKRCANLAGKTPDDVWEFPRLVGTAKERVKWHPCQLPESLLTRIIIGHSNLGDTVFDPFLGSGTTAVVAKRYGRNWVGCELSENYAKLAYERILNIEVNENLER